MLIDGNQQLEKWKYSTR